MLIITGGYDRHMTCPTVVGLHLDSSRRHVSLFVAAVAVGQSQDDTMLLILDNINTLCSLIFFVEAVACAGRAQCEKDWGELSGVQGVDSWVRPWSYCWEWPSWKVG